MKKQQLRRITLIVLTIFTAHLCCDLVAANRQPYQNPQLTAAERADDLLSRLTLDEKVKLMMDQSPAIARLGIPQFQWWNEALHGIGRNGYATVFPITMAMAASWDDQLLHQVFTAVSDEARVKAQQAKRAGKIQRYQSLSFWTPNINIFRDPRWGRGQETYGEDPFLTAKMGLAVVRGLQGYSYDGKPLDSKYMKLLACAKHFAVHSGPEWNRHEFNIENLPERDLWETYLPAFKSLVQEGDVAEVMCAYQRIDGQACCAQTRYEQQILRDEWGFQGLITSDCGAIRDFLPKWHNVARDGAEASAKAVLAGTDVECGSEYKNLPAAVHRGDIREADLDRSLRRLLVARFQLGDFDPDSLVGWTRIPASAVASKEHKQLALDMARKSIVLLKNNGVLPFPLPPSPRTSHLAPRTSHLAPRTSHLVPRTSYLGSIDIYRQLRLLVLCALHLFCIVGIAGSEQHCYDAAQKPLELLYMSVACHLIIPQSWSLLVSISSPPVRRFPVAVPAGLACRYRPWRAMPRSWIWWWYSLV